MYKNLMEMIEYPKEGILSKEIIKNEKIDASLFCMAKNSEISEHTSTKQAVVQVIEGSGIFSLEGKNIKMLPGVFIHMKENATHALKAKKNISFVLTLFK